MTFQETLGVIFYRKSQKLSLHLKTSMPVLKMKQESPLRLFVQIVVVNIVPKNLKIFVENMVFEESLQLHIHHNKMCVGEEKQNHFQHGEKLVSKRKCPKVILAGSSKLEHSCFE